MATGAENENQRPNQIEQGDNSYQITETPNHPPATNSDAITEDQIPCQNENGEDTTGEKSPSNQDPLEISMEPLDNEDNTSSVSSVEQQLDGSGKFDSDSESTMMKTKYPESSAGHEITLCTFQKSLENVPETEESVKMREGSKYNTSTCSIYTTIPLNLSENETNVAVFAVRVCSLDPIQSTEPLPFPVQVQDEEDVLIFQASDTENYTNSSRHALVTSNSNLEIVDQPARFLPPQHLVGQHPLVVSGSNIEMPTHNANAILHLESQDIHAVGAQQDPLGDFEPELADEQNRNNSV